MGRQSLPLRRTSFVLLDGYGNPIEYFRSPYASGDLTRKSDQKWIANTDDPDLASTIHLGDIIRLRPFAFAATEADVNVDQDGDGTGALLQFVQDLSGDASTSLELKSAEWAIFSGGADQTYNPWVRGFSGEQRQPCGDRTMRRALTLIELVVVVGIVLILVALVTSSFSSVVARAEEAKTQTAMRLLSAAIDAYEQGTGKRITLSRRASGAPPVEIGPEPPSAEQRRRGVQLYGMHRNGSHFLTTAELTRQLLTFKESADIIAKIDPSLLFAIRTDVFDRPPWVLFLRPTIANQI